MTLACEKDYALVLELDTNTTKTPCHSKFWTELVVFYSTLSAG